MKPATKSRCLNALNIVIVVATISIATALFLAQVNSEAIRQAAVVHETHIRTFQTLLAGKGSPFTIVDGKAFAGKYLLNGNYEIPDQIKTIFGGTATIFAGDVRVSTNVLKPDGNRAVGTRLEGPAYRRVFLEGKPYRGEALILGVPYFTAYDPIKDSRGRVIGALYVGDKKSEYLSSFYKLRAHVLMIAVALGFFSSLFIFLTSREKRRTERTLAERERQKRAILSNIPDLAWLKDKGGRFLAVNDAFAEACGMQPDELTGKTDFDVWPEDLARRYRMDDQKVMDTGVRQQSDEPLVNRHGSTVWTEAVRTPIYNDLGEVIGLTGIARDITERRRMEKSLKDSEATLREIFHNVNDGIILHEYDGTIFSFNNRALTMYDVNPDEITSLSIANDLSAPDNDFSLLPVFWERVLAGESRLFEWKAKRPKDGSVFFVEVFLNAIKLSDHDLILATITDISERKAHEEKIKHTLSVLSATLESTGDGILVLDPERNIVRYNRRFVEQMGLSEDEVITGQKGPLLLLDRVRRPEVLLKEHMAEDANPHMVSQSVLEFKDGRVMERVSHPQFVDGVIVGRVLSYRDVTEQRKLENQLRHAQKMEAVGTLTGGIAHDFNNLLTVIIGCGSVMQSQLEQSSPLRHYLDQVLGAAEKATGLTRGLLAYSRRQTLEPRVVDLNDIVGSVHKLLVRLIGENIELQTRLSPQPLSIMADGGQIEQVLMNLATNARDAISGTGSLTIETRVVMVDQEFIAHHGYGSAGCHALCTVTDTGKGMERENLERIFEPFFTTKDPGCGTGLGLSIVYGIVKQHNGHINVESEPGRGTTFELYLPLTDTGAQSAEPASALSERRGSETILLIEDNTEIRELFADVLARSGYRVLQAEDGEEGVEQFRKYRDAIDLLLIDVIMPKKNGKETYSEICAMGKEVKAIFMSGYTDDIINKKGILDSNLNFVAKPLAPGVLLDKVRSVLDQEN